MYLAQNKLPSTKTAIQKVETLPENIYYWNHKIITLYHSSLFAGHQG